MQRGRCPSPYHIPMIPPCCPQGAGDVLPDDLFCEQAGCRAVAVLGLWLFFPGDAASGCHFVIGAILKLCKDFFADMGRMSHDFFCHLWRAEAVLRQMVFCF